MKTSEKRICTSEPRTRNVTFRERKHNLLCTPGRSKKSIKTGFLGENTEKPDASGKYSPGILAFSGFYGPQNRANAKTDPQFRSQNSGFAKMNFAGKSMQKVQLLDKKKSRYQKNTKIFDKPGFIL